MMTKVFLILSQRRNPTPNPNPPIIQLHITVSRQVDFLLPPQHNKRSKIKIIPRDASQQSQTPIPDAVLENALTLDDIHCEQPQDLEGRISVLTLSYYSRLVNLYSYNASATSR